MLWCIALILTHLDLCDLFSHLIGCNSGGFHYPNHRLNSYAPSDAFDSKCTHTDIASAVALKGFALHLLPQRYYPCCLCSLCAFAVLDVVQKEKRRNAVRLSVGVSLVLFVIGYFPLDCNTCFLYRSKGNA